jgi:hypothetical protein
MSNNDLPKLARLFCEVFNTTLISASCFSTSIVDFIISEKALPTAYTAPAEAPNAKTRALEASNDLLNSLT